LRFHFNDRKTAQAAAFLLKSGGGTLNYMKLIKLMYLADRAMLLAKGIPITGDRMVAMKHGPVLSQVLDFINNGPDDGDNESAWFEYIEAPEGYDVSLKDGAHAAAEELDELSRYEMGVLKSIFEKYGAMDKWELVNLLHQILPEWADPGASASPIRPEQILRAEARPEEEIQQMKQSADELWLLDSCSR
jgi:uncharacterized phage-associated protein